MALKRAKKKYWSTIGPRIDPIQLEHTAFGWLAIISGVISVALGVITILGKLAEYILMQLGGESSKLPEYVKVVVIASMVVSFFISLVSGHLYSLHQLKFLHSSFELLVKQIDLQKFFTFDVDEDQIASVAIKRAAVDYVRHIGDLRHQVERFDASDALSSSGILLKDWSLIGVFIRQIINTLAERDQLAIWMGISLVTNPEGWDAQNDVVYQFENSIRHALSERILDRAYRIYYLEPKRGQSFEDLEDSLRQACHGLRPKAVFPLFIRTVRPEDKPTVVQDVSFVWVNQNTSDSKRRDFPDPSWSMERLQSEGWRIVVALEWIIRNNFLVDHVVVHSASEGWTGEHHRKMAHLWERSKPLDLHGSAIHSTLERQIEGEPTR